ncbi:MAG: YkgJ family cysteine cluster protein [Nitrospirales bacterium]|nr:YkgJ family cysteine cluster protein [Nitrospirales bacterium]
MGDNLEISSPQGFEEGNKPKKMKMSKRTSCVRCGNCCKGGAPALLKDDLRLFSSGIISHSDVYTLREGERVAFNDGSSQETFLEVVKLKEDKDGACSFYEGDGKCRIYEDRPYQCRAYKCWTAHEFTIPTDGSEDMLIGLEGNCITRKDLFKGVDLVLDVIARHDEKCSYERLASALEKAEEGNEEAMEDVMDILQYDASVRLFLVEKFSIPADALNLILGRPIAETIKGFGLTVEEGEEGFLLAPIKKDAPAEMKQGG